MNPAAHKLDENWHSMQLRLTCALLLSLVIVIFGAMATFVRIHIENHPWFIYRWLTVAGNSYTMLVCIPLLFVIIFSLIKREKPRSRTIYYLALSAATTEAVVLVASVISYLPIIPQPGADATLDMLVMHFFNPVLMILIFIFFFPHKNISRPKPIAGTAFLICYAIGLAASIGSGTLSGNLIPYYFLDLDTNPIWFPMAMIVLVLCLAYLFSWLLIKANKARQL